MVLLQGGGFGDFDDGGLGCYNVVVLVTNELVDCDQ